MIIPNLPLATVAFVIIFFPDVFFSIMDFIDYYLKYAIAWIVEKFKD